MAAEWGQKNSNKGEVNFDYYFGFTDETQLRTWFYRDKWLSMMKERGLKLTIWEVNATDAIIGHTQLAFIRERAKLVETRELV